MTRSVAGVGIGLRRSFGEALLRTNRRVDFLELIPEAFINQGGYVRRILDGCTERWPVLSHGVGLSLGGPDPLDERYLDSLADLLDRIDAPFFSDHASFSRARGIYFQDLLPMPFTEEAVDWMAARAQRAQAIVGRPLILENITYYAEMPGAEMSEGQFLRQLLDATDAGLLLDLNNVYVNAKNHERDPEMVLRELPLDRVRQIHLAGHHTERGLLIDTHGAPVCDAVWELFRVVLREIGERPTLLEWDTHLPPLDVILDEADRARAIQQEARSLVHLAKDVGVHDVL